MTIAQPAMLFASPLAGLATLAAAASIPLVIHLLNRRRHRVVEWAAMRFLLAATRKNVRRLRIEQLLLFAVRTSLIVLIVAAMCSVMPWAESAWQHLLPGGALCGPVVAGRTHKVVVIDGSLSMTAAAEDGSCFDRARVIADRLVRRSAAGDGFSLILLAAPARAVIAGPADDAGQVCREIESLRCPHGTADVGGALQLVDDVIRRAPGKYARREVYVFTDLQRSTWKIDSPVGGWTEAWSRLQTQVQTFVMDVGRPDLENVSVIGLTLADPLAVTGTRTTLTATVHNFGSQGRSKLRVELLAAGGNGTTDRPHVVRQETVAVAAGGAATVNFPYEFRSAGDYVFQARIEGDALQADDVRSLSVTARDNYPVLVVNGKPTGEKYEQAASWLADALFPFPESVRLPAYPARPKVVDLARFADPGAVDLSGYGCVFLCDVPRVNEREVERLEAHLRRGGGLVISLGPNVDLESYNRLLFRDGKGILPAKLVGHARAPAEGFFSPFADEEAFRTPPLAAFAGDDERSGLTAGRFKEYIRVEIPVGTAARRVLSLTPTFSDRLRESEPARGPADPLIVEWPRHRGRVVLVTSTVNTDWASWPIAPSFPPFVQELFRFALSQPPRRTLTVAEPIEELLPSSIPAGDVVVETPDGRKETVVLRAEPSATVFRFEDTDHSGLYRVRIAGMSSDLEFAVNVPTTGPGGGESDLRRLAGDELAALTPGDAVQVVTDLDSIRRLPMRMDSEAASGEVTPDLTTEPLGPGVARRLLLATFALLIVEGLLAWRFGSARSGPGMAIDRPESSPGRRRTDRLFRMFAAIPAIVVFGGAAVLLHAAWTGDVFGFLPSVARAWLETEFGIESAVAGEGIRWRLGFLSYLSGDPRTDLWLGGTMACAGVALAWWVYRREFQRRAGRGAASLTLVAIRSCLIAITLGLLLPQVRLLFEREGWPDVVLLIDDSHSMSLVDHYQVDDVKTKVAALSGIEGLPHGQRLTLVQALVTRGGGAWLDALVARQARVHVYHCSSRVGRVAEADSPYGVHAAAVAVRRLTADGPTSALGSAVRTILEEFRGSALAGIVMFTDGVTTEGDDLVRAAGLAARQGVPLYLVGVGDAHEPRDLVLSDLQVEDAVHVQDRLVFEARVTAKGKLEARSVPVTLSEKQGDQLKELARQEVALDPDGKPVKVRLTHTPASSGEHEYVLEVPGQPDESDVANNRLGRRIYVAEFQRTRVLYIEGYPRYEFRFLKTLLERESAATRANKTVDLKVILADADPDYAKEDRSALAAFPATRDELFKQFDLVILGDADPRNARLGEKQLQWIADFVREKGGGLLVIGGSQSMPRDYRESPLADVIPVELPSGEKTDDHERLQPFRLQLTPAGRVHPLFRFVPDEADNQAVWGGLPPMYWSAGPLKPKPAAEVLAVRKTSSTIGSGATESEPLAVQQFAGAGRAMYFAFDESWRWRLRRDEVRYNQFWLQAVKFLARSRLGRIELRTDKQVPYRQGEPIRLTIRFPDDVPPPDDKTPVQVRAEYVSPGGSVDVQTLRPARLSGARGTYEAVVDRTLRGEYRFWLAGEPTATDGPKPQTAARVLPPPGEMDGLRMNRPDLERAAVMSRGKFYTLADADRLPDDLPPLPRVPLNEPRPPWPIWNQPVVFLLTLTLVTAEWLLRKREQLL
jgi:hypothetical protein